MITISIDVTKVDKARLKEVVRKDGSTAKFLDLVLIETPAGKYGDYMVKQSCTKEERAARLEMPILGNGKDWSKGNRGAVTGKPTTATAQADPTDDGECPF